MHSTYSFNYLYLRSLNLNSLAVTSLYQDVCNNSRQLPNSQLLQYIVGHTHVNCLVMSTELRFSTKPRQTHSFLTLYLC